MLNMVSGWEFKKWCLGNEKRKKFVDILCYNRGVLLGGVGSIGLSSYLTEHLEGNMYNFDFDLMTRDYNYSSNDKIHLHNFVFYYDFSQNKGDISFDLNNKNWSLAYIDIEFPSVVDNKTIKIYTTKNGIKTDVIANIKTRENYREVSEINYTYLEISKFKRTFNDDKFVIEFKSDLQPKGRFGFYNSPRDFLHANSKQGNVNFVLGDDYECTGGCVYNLQYIEETPKSFDMNLKLKFKKGEENHCSLFKLNTISRKILFWKSFFLGLGISLMVASLSFIFGLLYKYGKEKNC